MRTNTRIQTFSIVSGFFLGTVLSALLVIFSWAAPVNAAAGSKQKGAETPEKLLSQIAEYCLAGDSTNLLRCFDTSDRVHELGAKTFAISIELAKAKVDLREALLKKFTPEQVDGLKGNYVFPTGANPLKKVSDSFQNPIIKVDGDHASVGFGNSSEVPLHLEKKDSRWLLVRGLEGMAAEDADQAFDLMEANRYFALGIRDCLKIVPKMKTIEEAQQKIPETVEKQVATFWKESDARLKK